MGKLPPAWWCKLLNLGSNHFHVGITHHLISRFGRFILCLHLRGKHSSLAELTTQVVHWSADTRPFMSQARDSGTAAEVCQQWGTIHTGGAYALLPREAPEGRRSSRLSSAGSSARARPAEGARPTQGSGKRTLTKTRHHTENIPMSYTKQKQKPNGNPKGDPEHASTNQ